MFGETIQDRKMQTLKNYDYGPQLVNGISKRSTFPLNSASGHCDPKSVSKTDESVVGRLSTEFIQYFKIAKTH